MFCSTIIPTIGRSTLSRAVHSVLDQTFTADDFEVIVVNDTGKPLPEADWQRSERVRVIVTNRRERSVARNTGAAIARGKYLHFLDDDDWILPDALENFWTLTNTSDAEFLYGSARLMESTEKCLYEINLGMSGNCFAQVMAGEWIPTGAYLIESKVFFAVGGFNPLASIREDFDFCRRVALRANFASTSPAVLCILRGSSWDTSSDITHAEESSLWAREKILSEPQAFTRLRTSANSSYWRGRVVRTYLSSVIWNLRCRCVYTAAGQATFGIVSFVLAGHHVLSKSFWRGVVTPHVSRIRNPA
jgi:hypothetical protein